MGRGLGLIQHGLMLFHTPGKTNTLRKRDLLNLGFTAIGESTAGSSSLFSSVSEDYAMGDSTVRSSSKRLMATIETRPHHEHGGAQNKMFRSHSVDSADDWGFFEDFEPSTPTRMRRGSDVNADEEQPLQRALSLPPPASAAPMYVLESTLATQQLWYSTAGLRPQQPQKEREYFENLWKRNFKNSDVPCLESPKKVRSPM